MKVTDKIKNIVSSELDSLVDIYKKLHAQPELSGYEKNTSKLLTAELESCGMKVVDNIGGYGIAGCLENGEGRTILIRTDMDALPIAEDSGLDYASKVITEDENGASIPVMHACGHDIHMSSFIGTARVLTKLKENWRGKIIFVGQPAEESLSGARKMLNAGLMDVFGSPEACLAMHVLPGMQSGKIGIKHGLIWAGAFEAKITVRGIVGHGAIPHLSKDPIVLAAHIITSIQSIISRELNPLTPAVITVGAINGGSRANIIPDKVVLKLTVRFNNEKTRDHIHESIKRICKYEAICMGMPENLLPKVEINPNNKVPPLENDSDLIEIIKESALELYNNDFIEEIKNMLMVSEDFSLFKNFSGKNIPCAMFFVGATDKDELDNKAKSCSFTGLHNNKFAPEPSSLIQSTVSTMSAAALKILNK